MVSDHGLGRGQTMDLSGSIEPCGGLDRTFLGRSPISGYHLKFPLKTTILRATPGIEGGGRQPRAIPTKGRPSQVVFRGCRKRSEKGVRSLFSFLVTFRSLFSDVSVTLLVTSLPKSFCWTPFAGLLLRQGELLEPKERAKIHTTPSLALAMLIDDFVGVVRTFRGPMMGIHTGGFIFHRVLRAVLKIGALALQYCMSHINLQAPPHAEVGVGSTLSGPRRLLCPAIARRNLSHYRRRVALLGD